jgi:Mn-dependent DtxR family transcriptional regulator
MKKRTTETFTGTIDELLDHVSDVDDTMLEIDIEQSKVVEEVANSLNVSKEEATELIEEAKLEAVKETLNGLIEKGLVEVVEYKDGEPLYGLTEDGKKISSELLSQ